MSNLCKTDLRSHKSEQDACYNDSLCGHPSTRSEPNFSPRRTTNPYRNQSFPIRRLIAHLTWLIKDHSLFLTIHPHTPPHTP